MLTVVGSFHTTLMWKGVSTVQHVSVLPTSTVPLLGFPAIQALGVWFEDALARPERIQ